MVLIFIAIFARSDAAAISSPSFVRHLFENGNELRVATNRERRLLISVNLTLVPRPLLRFNVHGGSGDGEKSDPFAEIEEDEDRLENKPLYDC